MNRWVLAVAPVPNWTHTAFFFVLLTVVVAFGVQQWRIRKLRPRRRHNPILIAAVVIVGVAAVMFSVLSPRHG